MTDISRRRTTFWVLCAVSVVSLAWSQRNADFLPQRIVLSAIGTVERVISSVGRGVAGTVTSVRELRDLRREYTLVLDQLQEYRSVATDLEVLSRENDRLREQLGFLERIEFRALPARVVGKSEHTIYTTLTINRGERHGIRPGQPVVAYTGGKEGLVGRVQRVSDWYAVILPVFAVNSFVGARLERSRFEGLIEGTGYAEDPMRMRYVASQARDGIEYGEPVVTSGLSSRFPPDLRVGTVREVSSPPYEPSLVLRVDSIVDFDRLEFVSVLLSEVDR